MAIGYLTLSRNSAGANSSWSGYESGYSEVRYTTPSWGGQAVTVTIPAEMEGATFNSATLSYSVSSPGGTRRVAYHNESTLVSNANLLERLISGGSLDLYFSYQATGGTGGEGSHSATCIWNNITITVDYTPATGLTGNATITNAGTVIYSLEKPSLAYGETMTFGLTVRPTRDITRIETVIYPGSLTPGITLATDKNVAANGGASLSYTLAITAEVYAAMTQRAHNAQIQITLTGANGTTYTTGRIACQDATSAQRFKLLKARTAPVISAVTWSESGSSHISAYGNLIAGKTVPVISFTVALDTDADSGIGYESRVLQVGGKTYTLNTNGGTLQPISESGTVDYTITVTDSYGQVGTLAGTVTVLAYTPPTLKNVAISRYVASLNAQGQTVYELDDDGTSVWLDAEITCQVALGTGSNTWTLTITPGGGSAVTVAANQSLASKTYTHDRSALTGSYAATSEYSFSVELSDSFTTLRMSVTVPKAGGIFNIELTGVAVGMRSTGTEQEPLFEVGYKAHFRQAVYDKNGNELTATPDDTGWDADGITLTYCAQYSRTVGVRRRNGMVFLRGAIKLTNQLSSGSGSAGQVQIGTLDEAYRPEQEYDFAIVLEKTNGYLRMIVNSSGVIKLHNYSGYAIGNGVMIPINACWCAND